VLGGLLDFLTNPWFSIFRNFKRTIWFWSYWGGKKFGMKEPSVSVISKTQRAFCFHETETGKEPWVSGWFFHYSSFLWQFYIRISSLFFLRTVVMRSKNNPDNEWGGGGGLGAISDTHTIQWLLTAKTEWKQKQ
jgi:hypothetical protein